MSQIPLTQEQKGRLKYRLELAEKILHFTMRSRLELVVSLCKMTQQFTALCILTNLERTVFKGQTLQRLRAMLGLLELSRPQTLRLIVSISPVSTLTRLNQKCLH